MSNKFSNLFFKVKFYFRVTNYNYKVYLWIELKQVFSNEDQLGCFYSTDYNAKQKKIMPLGRLAS